MKRAGLAGFTSQRVLESLSDYLCYLELHVEQGGVLADSKEQIGVVQGIVCIHNLDVTFRGVPNHAGTTPMKGRKDALVGASELVVKVAEAVSKAGGGATTGTCGQLEVSPGARNVIPGEVKLAIEVRDLLPQVADRVLSVLMSEARLISERYCLEVDFERVSRTPPAGMDDKIQKTIFGQAKSLGLKTRYMPSGASHDAAVFAKYVPTGMIFVPSRDGISHSPDEWTDKQDCINGANVLLKTLLYIAEQGEGFFS